MTVKPSDENRGTLIVVDGAVWGPRGKLPLTLVLDTGSWQTLIVPDIMDELGFNPRDGQAITAVYSAIGKEQGYMIIFFDGSNSMVFTGRDARWER